MLLVTTEIANTLENIISVSKAILVQIEPNDISSKRSTRSRGDDISKDKELIDMMAKRDRLIHQVFEQFSHDELKKHSSALTSIYSLDKMLVENINKSQKSAKSKIVAFKKNKKAINIYQKI